MKHAAKACTSKLHKGSHDHAEPPRPDRDALLLKAEATIIGEWGPKNIAELALPPHRRILSQVLVMTHTASQLNRRDDASGTERDGIHVYCRAWEQVRTHTLMALSCAGFLCPLHSCFLMRVQSTQLTKYVHTH